MIGNRFINAQLIADQFAANGFFVVMPDIFNGDPLPLNRPGTFDMAAWRKNHGVETVEPILQAAIKEMKETYGVKKIGTVGYCFGAKYVVKFLKKGVTDAGYVAHPSGVTEEEVREIEQPFSIAAAGECVGALASVEYPLTKIAETDGAFPSDKRHTTEAILQEIKVPYQINLYSGVVHGFAVRGDLSKRVGMYAKEQAFLQAVFWFQEHLKE